MLAWQCKTCMALDRMNTGFKNGLPSVWTLWTLWLLWMSRTSSTKGLHFFLFLFSTHNSLFRKNCTFLKADRVVTQAPSEGWSPRYHQGMCDSGVSWGVSPLLGTTRVTHWHPKMPLALGDAAKPSPRSSWGSTAIIFPCVKQFFRVENHCSTHDSTGVVDKCK